MNITFPEDMPIRWVIEALASKGLRLAYRPEGDLVATWDHELLAACKDVAARRLAADHRAQALKAAR